MLRRRRGQVTDPRDLGSATRGGRFSRFRRGRQEAPRPPAEPSGGGGCCLWPFMLALVVGAALVARAAGARRARRLD